MKLIEPPGWTQEISEKPPAYIYEGLTLPSEVSVRYINTLHHTDGGGVPDYLDEVLAGVDVFVPEMPGWTGEHAKQFVGLAKGNAKARERVIARGARTIEARDPGMYEYVTFAMNALYNTQVSIPMVDYPLGRDFNEFGTAIESGRITVDLYMRRERFVIASLGRSLHKLRKTNPNLKDKPMNVAMWYGAMHMGIADGIREVARRGGTDVQVTEEYEESLDGRNESVPKSVLELQRHIRY